MAAEIDTSSYSGLAAASEKLEMRMAIRRASPAAQPADEVGQESPEQKEAADRAALRDWLVSAVNLLDFWVYHLTDSDSRSIEGAEVELLVQRLEKVRGDMDSHVYGKDSLLPRLGYSEKLAAWEAELARPWEILKDAIYPYRNGLRLADLSRLKDSPTEALNFENQAYRMSKEIRKAFSGYAKGVIARLTAIRILIEHGN